MPPQGIINIVIREKRTLMMIMKLIPRITCRFNDTLKDMLESAYNGNVKHDLTWWSESYGADMPRNWPQFEVRFAFLTYLVH